MPNTTSRWLQRYRDLTAVDTAAPRADAPGGDATCTDTPSLPANAQACTVSPTGGHEWYRLTSGAVGGTDNTDKTVSVTSHAWRCPNPACMGIIAQANAYVLAKLAGRLAANYTPLFTSPAYHDLRGQLVEALRAGDLDATKTYCRRWCQLVIAWTAQQRSVTVDEERKGAPDGV
jgi:hypothetical protein